MQPIAFILVCAVAVGGLLAAEWRGNEAAKRLFKTLASLAFIGLAMASGAADTPFGRCVLAGLVLCAAGDVFLLSRSSAMFLAGMGAFAAGHAAYTAAFAMGGALIGMAAIAGFGATAIAGGLLVRYLKDGLGGFRVPVIIYSLIISLMVGASLAHHAAAPSLQSYHLALAAAGFAASDVAVAFDRFGKARFLNRLWGLPLYYAAQCLFAVSV